MPAVRNPGTCMSEHGNSIGPVSPDGPELTTFGSETFLGSVLDTLSMFVGILSPAGLLLAANEAPLKAAGLTSDQVLGRPFWECYWWSHDAALQGRLKRAVEQARAGERVRYDADVRIGEGEVLPIDFMLAPMRRKDGQIAYLVASGVDLSERRAIEARLRDSEAQSRRQLAELEAIYQTAPIGLCVLDTNFRFVRINERLAEINGQPAEAHIGRCIREVVPGLADQTEPLLRQAIQSAKPAHGLEIEGETPAAPGKTRVWRENWTPIVDAASQEVLGVNVVAEEITEWKQAEQRLRESEARARNLAEQRELLLQELNHRVKNSLALVASMLALQRRQHTGDGAAALADAHRRILTIAKVHESLYVATTGDRIDLVSFSEKLMVQANDLRPDVVTRFEAFGPASLPADRAVSFGLLLNELVVNAVKHAFSDGEPGKVDVRLGPRDDDTLLLSVVDSGGGLPAGWTLEGAKSLGSRLILGLADQLGATIATQSAPGEGSRFELTIPTGPTGRRSSGAV
jgi:PAS domain S-box-containing protein